MNSADKKNSSGTWQQALRRLAERVLGKKQGHALCVKYRSLATENYQALVPPRFALKDMLHLERLDATYPSVSLLNPSRHVEHYRLHFYSRQERFLDEYIPLLENLHLRVMDQVQFTGDVKGARYFIKSFTIKPAQAPCKQIVRLRPRLLDAIQAILTARVENDGLNKLIILTGMDWQEIDVLRAYRNYYLQLGHRTSRASIHHALLCNPDVALCLYHYFDERFRPYGERETAEVREEQFLLPMHLNLLKSMEKVADLNDDRILRNLFNLIDATMRCNFHLRRQSLDDYFIAFKINSLGVIEMPPPKPQYEIYVHAATMQGIHLRAGKVSRGGIRWSDRPDDFRSEILGLMQTQIAKNALIVPTGAKGGFVLTGNSLRSEMKEAGKRAYLTLIEGLLDLTDNYDDAQIVSTPPNLVVYDDPDPYLVVAADKGTAQFSDIANAVSADYRFWLGDAFASGGSCGYNHKALGITARGAWECVKRHFRELGKDIQNEAFTAVGVGSMDGDVFGNGMLLSPCIRLLAAFSGQHIFLDPNPPEDESAFLERKRLFELPGSSWDDYDRSLLSKGGGVYLRSAKDIPLSSEVKGWLGVHYRALDGESLIRYLLTAETDLLWLGGIGTYVKSSAEKHEDVSDRANDNVRIDASALRAKVVGEGANLGFTQKARIEYNLKGGRINTDAVDNSAGVDTSDHEVNLKILLTLLGKRNLLADSQTLFAEVTEEVCRLVLADNYAQSQCLSLEQLRGAESAAAFFKAAERLEGAGFLDGVRNVFPGEKEVQGRPDKSLARPELAVLMAGAKMFLTEQIQAHTALLEEPCCERYLRDYFPERIAEDYPGELPLHPLADKIKATFISNKIINQAGSGFLVPDNGEKIDLLEQINCYLAFERILEADALRRRIECLDNQVPAALQYRLLLDIELLLEHFCRWALARALRIRPDAATMALYRDYLNDYWEYFHARILAQDEAVNGRLAHYEAQGIADELALKMAFFGELHDFLWLVDLALRLQQDLASVSRRYQEIRALLGLDVVFDRLSGLPSQDSWQDRVGRDLQEQLMTLTGRLLIAIMSSPAPTCAAYFEALGNRDEAARYFDLAREVGRLTPTHLYPYLVLCGQLERLADSLSVEASDP
ncbi:NAD-glutamate dehydrogenase domain-containing protein [Methylomicrobium sp. RS1]|uniref:NAD-glutamate dehydrogenase domain-containing protein n=1 Tax=Candidatus Methylomicrobium oryzae TaxID=2802053 RepID=UPI001923AA98|nr:NAD-glutamate dehydrogenase domain-containing protein [Methylomicrobium sp. RS1]MBL1265528.1 NAD-glutamate dehydrogenase [Methylomicrobium sp. RS1]